MLNFYLYLPVPIIGHEALKNECFDRKGHVTLLSGTVNLEVLLWNFDRGK